MFFSCCKYLVLLLLINGILLVIDDHRSSSWVRNCIVLLHYVYKNGISANTG